MSFVESSSESDKNGDFVVSIRAPSSKGAWWGDWINRLLQSIREHLFFLKADIIITDEEKQRIDKSKWHSAVDLVTRRVYYYNCETNQTKWDKPLDLATGLQHLQILEREQMQRNWFAAMEFNIRAHLVQGRMPGTCHLKQGSIEEPQEEKCILTLDKSTMNAASLGQQRDSFVSSSSHHLRTISRMDDKLLLQLNASDDRASTITNTLRYNIGGKGGLESIVSTRKEVMASPTSPRDFENQIRPLTCRLHTTNSLSKDGHRHVRSNTEGKVQPRDTIYTPDLDATIEVVCGVYRTHIVAAALQDNDTLDLKSFRDTFMSQNSRLKINSCSGISTVSASGIERCKSPTIDEIINFFKEFFRRGKMEPDCIITTLVYAERLIKITQGKIRPHPTNWRSILLSCMILSSKVLDDLSMRNLDFSLVVSGFSLQQINELEVTMLNALSYHVKVSTHEYAKYYFLLRSMLLRYNMDRKVYSTMNFLNNMNLFKGTQHQGCIPAHRRARSFDNMYSLRKS